MIKSLTVSNFYRKKVTYFQIYKSKAKAYAVWYKLRDNTTHKVTHVRPEDILLPGTALPDSMINTTPANQVNIEASTPTETVKAKPTVTRL